MYTTLVTADNRCPVIIRVKLPSQVKRRVTLQ